MKQIAVVCFGNIARSQVLSVYVKKFLQEAKKKDINIYSAGIALKSDFPNEKSLIKEVEEKLASRGIKLKIKRNAWSKKVKNELRLADLILVADNKIKKELEARLNRFKPIYGMHTFYEFIGEGEKDFVDTYNFKKKQQDPIKFEKLFNELERIGKKIIDKLNRSKILN